MPTFKEFAKTLYAKIKKNDQQSTSYQKTSADLLSELQTTYHNYNEHMLLKVLPILDKEIHSIINRELKQIDMQIKQLDLAIKEESKQIGLLSRKGNIHGKNTPQIVKHEETSHRLRSQLKALQAKRLEVIFPPQRAKLRDAKEYIRKNNVRDASLLAWQLCKEIQSGSPFFSAAPLKSNDQDNIKRFVKVVELEHTLKQGTPGSIVAFYNLFKNQGGEKAILGENQRRFFTEKGMVWRKTTELLTKIATSLGVNFDAEIQKQQEKNPASKTSEVHDQKEIEQGPPKHTKK